MSDFTPYIGGIAALFGLAVRKAWPRGATKDLSLGMLTALGLALWIVYGALRGDWMVVSANAIGATLAAVVLGCKLRDSR